MNILKYKIKKILEGRYFGTFESLLKGSGLEIEDFKEYQFGDDIKHINWKLSAKYNKTFVNVYRKESDTNIDVFWDINANWKSGHKEINKELVYQAFSQILEFTSKNNGNLRLYYTENNELQVQKIGANKEKGFVWMSRIDEKIKKLRKKYQSNVDEFVKYQTGINKRHIIIIFSDFLDISEKTIKRLKVLQDKNEILLFKIPVNGLQGWNFINFLRQKQKKETSLEMYDLSI